MNNYALLTVLALGASAAVEAQEHWTEGPVWIVECYRTRSGHFDDYLKWIRANIEPQNIEAKKQRLILDFKTFLQFPKGPNDPDVCFATLYPNAGKALDFDQGVEDKFDAISAAHWKAKERDKQRELAKPRLELRDYVGTTLHREVVLKPLKK